MRVYKRERMKETFHGEGGPKALTARPKTSRGEYFSIK